MGRKFTIFQLTLALLLIVMGSTSFAAKTATIKGTIQSDKVEIVANLLSETGEITPGERAKQLLTISNLGSDCYIRVIPKVKAKDISVSDLEFDCGNDWKKINESYYYTKVFKKDKSVGFCESMLIPAKAPIGDISVEYGIDAIQSDNFEPEFTSLNPWGNVEIVEVKNRGQSLVVKTLGSQKADKDTLEIHYNEEAKSLITNFDEIFKDVPLIKPGDSYVEEIKLKNSSKEAKTLYLSDVTDESHILKFIDVSISSEINGEKREVFKGSLGEDFSGKKLNAGTLLPGEEGSLIISANMSKDANNEASSLSTHLSIETWVDSVVGAKDETGMITEKTDNNSLQIRSAKTGDDFRGWKWMIIAGCMIMAGVYLVKKKER